MSVSIHHRAEFVKVYKTGCAILVAVPVGDSVTVSTCK